MTEKEQKTNYRPSLLPGLLGILLVVGLIAAGSYYAFRPQEDTLQGEVEVDEYRVSSKVPGRILELRVKEGDQVRAGDILAILEAPEVNAKLDQAQAAQAAAAAQDHKAEKGARQEQITAAYEMWQKAKAGVDIAQKSFERVQRLHTEGVTTAQKLDEATASRDAAIATEKAAKAQYDMARNGAETEDKQAANALVDRAKGAVKEVRSYLNETILRASHDGEVTDIFPEVGELVGTGSPVMNVARLQTPWATLNVREDRLERFRIGATLDAFLPALGNKAVKLQVYYVKSLGTYASWKATKTTGQFDLKTFEVRARFQGKVDGLRPGMTVVIQ